MKNKIYSLVILGIILSLLTACNSLSPSSHFISEPVAYIIPAIGIVNRAYIGDSLLKEGIISPQSAILLKNSVRRIGESFPAGEYRFSGSTDKYLIYEYKTKYPNGFFSSYIYPQILEDEFGNIYLNRYYGEELLSAEKFKKISAIVDDYNYEQTLVFTGSDGKVLRFTYREFIDDMARPAYTIDATYDISKDKIIRFKNVLIEIIEVSNQEITYKLLSGFKK